MIHCRFLGAFQVSRGDSPTPVTVKGQRVRWLLAYLAVHAEGITSRARAIQDMWPGWEDSRARRALNQTIWQTRRSLGREIIHSQGDTIRLSPEVTTDVSRFLHLSQAQDIPTLRQAVDLYRGDFLPDCDQDWALIERERLRARYIETLQRLVIAYRDRGEYEAALPWARELVRQEPLHETAHELLIHLYLSLGQPHKALQQYNTLATLLMEELGVSPSQSLRALQDRIRNAMENDTVRPAPLFTVPQHMTTVGRQKERELLFTALEHVRGGHITFVLIEGAPGMGKSRLLQDVHRGAEWRGFHSVYVTTSSRGGSYSPLVEALDQRLTPVTLAHMHTHLPPETLNAAAHLLPALGTPLPDVRPHQLEEALARIILTLAHQHPLLLLLDDIHNASPEVLRILERVASSAPSAPLIIILAYRPLEMRNQPGMWETLQALDRSALPHRLLLAPLSEEEKRLLIAQALGTDKNSPAVTQVAEITNGVPLYIVEVLRFLHRRGLLQRTGDGLWVLTQPPHTLPPRVQDLIQARVQRLPARERRTLQILAVIGENVHEDIALALLGPGLPTLFDMFVRLGFLAREKGRYRFSHALVHRAVYESVPEATRRRVHEEVARHLRDQDPVEWANVAWHLQQAGRIALAVAAYETAAQEALRVFAHEKALALCDDALALAENVAPSPTTCRLHLSRSQALMYLGHFARARSDVARALRDARRLNHPLLLAQGCLLAGRITYRQGDYRQAETFLRRAHRLAQTQRAPHIAAEALCVLSDVRLRAGKGEEAREHALTGQAIYRDLGATLGQAHAAYRVAVVEMELGNEEAARQAFQETLSLARREKSLYQEGAALNGLAILALNARNTTEARRTYLEVLAIAERLGDHNNRAMTLHNLAVTALMAGRIGEALRYTREVVPLARKIGSRHVHLLASLLLGNLNTLCGHLDEAEKVLRASLEEAEDMGHAAGVSYAWRNMGIWARERGDAEQGFTWGEMALKRLHTLGLERQLPTAALELAHTALILQDPQAALQALDMASIAPIAPALESILNAVRAHALADMGQTDHARELVARVVPLLDQMLEDEYLPLAWYAVAQAVRTWDEDAARRFTVKAYHALQWQSFHLKEDHRDVFMHRPFTHRLITQAWEAEAPRPVVRMQVRLPSRTGKGTTLVTWTVDAGDEDAAVKSRLGAQALRRYRLARLLQEAREQGARATHAALAEALNVSIPTVRRDLAALQAERGHPPDADPHT